MVMFLSFMARDLDNPDSVNLRENLVDFLWTVDISWDRKSDCDISHGVSGS